MDKIRLQFLLKNRLSSYIYICKLICRFFSGSAIYDSLGLESFLSSFQWY